MTILTTARLEQGAWTRLCFRCGAIVRHPAYSEADTVAFKAEHTACRPNTSEKHAAFLVRDLESLDLQASMHASLSEATLLEWSQRWLSAKIAEAKRECAGRVEAALREIEGAALAGNT